MGWDQIRDECPQREVLGVHSSICKKEVNNLGGGNYRNCDIRNCPKTSKNGDIELRCSCGYGNVKVKIDGGYIWAYCDNCGAIEYL
ncbi:MAG: hypothetical protein ACOCRK_07965 [bacterium]